MSLNDLLPALLKLSHEEKVQAIKILQDEVHDKGQTQDISGAAYEVWSPQITPETGRILLDLLRED